MKAFVNSRPIFYCFLTILLSILSARFLFYLDISHLLVVVAFSVVLIILMEKYRKIALSLVLIFSFLFGMCWFFLGVKTFDGHIYNGSQTVSGRVTDNIKTNENYLNIVLDEVKINGKSDKNIELVIYGQNLEIPVGSILNFESEVENVKLFNLGSFDSTSYRNKTAYSARVDCSKVEIVGSKIKLSERIRLYVKDLLFSKLSEDTAPVAYAVLFGDKTSIEEELYDSYRYAGVVHILTVSGLHITFLIALLGFILKKLKVKRGVNFVVCLIFILLYAYLCGFKPSVLRASIMGIVLLVGMLSGSWYDSLNAVGFAGLLILLFSPLSAFDGGFLMSFGSVVAIILLTPVLLKPFKKKFLKRVFGVFAVCISAQIATLPILASYYSAFNLLSFLANFVIVPLFSVFYPILFLLTLVSAILPFLSFILVPGGWMFGFLNTLVLFFNRFGIVINLEPFDFGVVCLAATIIFIISRFVMLSVKTKVRCVSILAILLALSCLMPLVTDSSRQSILYSYSYGDSMLVLTNSAHKTLLVDGESYSFIKNGLNSVNCNLLVGRVGLNNSIERQTKEYLKLENDFCHDGLAYSEGSERLELDKEYIVAGFCIKYLSYGGSLLGASIKFDDTNLFVVYNDAKITENIVNYLNTFEFNYVIMNMKTKNLDKFTSASVITFYDAQGTNYSVKESGSLKLVYKNKKYSLVGVD